MTAITKYDTENDTENDTVKDSKNAENYTVDHAIIGIVEQLLELISTYWKC